MFYLQKNHLKLFTFIFSLDLQYQAFNCKVAIVILVNTYIVGKRIFTVGCTPLNTLFKNRKGGKKKLIKLHIKDYYFISMRPELFSSKSHSNIRNLSSALLVVKERENKKISIFQERLSQRVTREKIAVTVAYFAYRNK